MNFRLFGKKYRITRVRKNLHNTVIIEFESGGK